MSLAEIPDKFKRIFGKKKRQQKDCIIVLRDDAIRRVNFTFALRKQAQTENGELLPRYRASSYDTF